LASSNHALKQYILLFQYIFAWGAISQQMQAELQTEKDGVQELAKKQMMEISSFEASCRCGFVHRAACLGAMAGEAQARLFGD